MTTNGTHLMHRRDRETILEWLDGLERSVDTVQEAVQENVYGGQEQGLAALEAQLEQMSLLVSMVGNWSLAILQHDDPARPQGEAFRQEVSARLAAITESVRAIRRYFQQQCGGGERPGAAIRRYGC